MNGGFDDPSFRAFHVASSHSALRSTGMGEAAKTSDDVLALPDQLLTAEERQQREAEVQARRNQKAMTSVKSFLQTVFEDFAEEAADGNLRRTAVHAGTVPVTTYRDSLRREVAKPQVLSTTVTTDRAPLPTKTGPTTFTMFDPDVYTIREGVQQSRGIYDHMMMAHNRDMMVAQGQRMLTKDRLPGQATERSWVDAWKATKNAGTFYDEDEQLRRSHLASLMNAIDRAKRAPPRKPSV